jgi:hypothetical protein
MPFEFDHTALDSLKDDIVYHAVIGDVTIKGIAYYANNAQQVKTMLQIGGYEIANDRVDLKFHLDYMPVDPIPQFSTFTHRGNLLKYETDGVIDSTHVTLICSRVV